MARARVGDNRPARRARAGRRRQDRAGRVRVAAACAAGEVPPAGRARGRRVVRPRRDPARREGRIETAGGGGAHRRSGTARGPHNTQGIRRAASQGAAGPGGSLAGGSRPLRARSGAPRRSARNLQRRRASDARHAAAGAGTALRHLRPTPLLQRPAAQPAHRHGHRRTVRHAGRRGERGTGDRHRRLFLPRPHRHPRPRAGVALALRAPERVRGESRRRPSRPARRSARWARPAGSPGRICTSRCTSTPSRSIRRCSCPTDHPGAAREPATHRTDRVPSTP